MSTPFLLAKSVTGQAFAANLLGLRGDRSQVEFARLLGIKNQATYQRYEKGRLPRSAILEAIAKKMGVSVSELVQPISAARQIEIARALAQGGGANPAGPAEQSRIRAFKMVEFFLRGCSDDQLRQLMEMCERQAAQGGLLDLFWLLIRDLVDSEASRRAGPSPAHPGHTPFRAIKG